MHSALVWYLVPYRAHVIERGRAFLTALVMVARDAQSLWVFERLTVLNDRSGRTLEHASGDGKHYIVGEPASHGYICRTDILEVPCSHQEIHDAHIMLAPGGVIVLLCSGYCVTTRLGGCVCVKARGLRRSVMCYTCVTPCPRGFQRTIKRKPPISY